MGALGQINSATSVYTKAEADASAPLIVAGGETTYVSASTATIGTTAQTSYVKDSTNVYIMTWSGTLGLNIATSGAGGLDTGAEAASTWYAVYVIGDTTNVNTPVALMSASFTAPTLPAGYDVFRRLFAIRNNGSSNFLKWLCIDKSSQRRIFYDMTFTAIIALSAGNSTAYAAVSLASLVPPTSQVAFILPNFENVGGASGDIYLLRPTDSTVAVGAYSGSVGILLTSAIGQTPASTIVMPTNSAQSIDYIVSSASDGLSLYVQGYLDVL